MRRRCHHEQHLASRSVWLMVVLITTALSFPTTTWGQEVTASITGKVADPSSAIIAGAKVTAKDLDRGTLLTTETNAAGFYNLPRVPIGTYDIRVEVVGFQTAIHPPVHLELNQTARVDFVMQLGEVTQTVEVTGAPPLLQTDTMELGSVINSKTNEDFPLATRNYIQLTLLAPGSVNPNPQTLTNGQTTANGGRPYVNGNREQANNFLLDGLDNKQVSDNLVGYAPSPDAIQEFNMITNNAPADFGNFQGGIVSTTIKSGTNQLHGSAFEFFRNDVLNANTWEGNWSGSPRPKVRWNMFGGSAGGPVVEDKLFFFGDYQGERFNNPASTSPIGVFTAAERQGDFSQLLTERDIQLYNPFLRDASGSRVPLPNNQIPAELIDPVARSLFASNLYPLPVNGNLQNNQFNTTSSKTVGDQFDAKIDANLSTVDHIFVRYSQSRQHNPSTNSFPLFFDSFFNAPPHNGVATW